MEVSRTMSWIHIGAVHIMIKATFKEGIDSPIDIDLCDKRMSNLQDSILGTIWNLCAEKIVWVIYLRIAYNLTYQDFSRALTLHQKRNSVDHSHVDVLIIYGSTNVIYISYLWRWDISSLLLYQEKISIMPRLKLPPRKSNSVVQRASVVQSRRPKPRPAKAIQLWSYQGPHI